MKLKVKQAPKYSIGNDIVYVHKDDRGSLNVNKVCKISVADKYVYVTVRGNNTAGEILIDKQVRMQLGVELDKEYEFSIDYKLHYFLIAPFYATNAGVRAAYIIAFISVLIGVNGKWGYVRYFLDLCVLILFTF